MRMMRKILLPGGLRAILLTIGLMVVTAATSSAAVSLFNNLAAGSPNGSFGVSNTQWTAQAFTTTATEFTIQQVSLRLWNQNGTTGEFEVQIWDANGSSGRPGSPAATTIFTGLAQDLGSAEGATLDITGLNVILEGGTTYYLVIRGSGLTDVGDEPFSSAGSLYWDATDVLTSDAFDTGDSGANWNGPYTQNLYMSISAGAVPEASSLVLSAVATGPVLLRRRRR